jgi:hypothetical protein
VLALPVGEAFRLASALVVALAALVRFSNLGASSLWYDEGFSAFVASEPIPDLVAHTARDIHPPLYYLLLHGWMHLAGKSDFALAFFSLGFGVLSVALVIGLARRWFGSLAGLLAGFAAAVSPFQIWYSQEVRMYTLAAFVGLLVVGTVARGARRDLVLYACAGAIGLYLLYYLAFLLVTVNLVMLGWWTVARRLPGGWTVRRWLLAQALVVVLYLPWLPIAVQQALAPTVPPWREFVPPAAALLESAAVFAAGQVTPPPVALTLLIAGLVLLALGAVRDPTTRTPLLLCVAAVVGPLLLILAVSVLTPLYHPRYLFPFSLPVSVLVGLGLARLVAAAPPLGAVALAALLIGSATAVQAYHTDDRLAPDDYRSAVAFIAERWQPGDGILINAGYVYAPFVHYWPRPIGWRGRLTEMPPPVDGPIVYQTGTIDGPASLGGGDPRADFYPTTWQETEAGLRRIAARHPRLWVLRGYDTVTDPRGQVRQWLVDHGRLFEDVVVRGPSNVRVQGWIVGEVTPPATTSTDGLLTVGYDLVRNQAPAGRAVSVAVAWRPTGPVDQPLRAYLALVDEDGRIWAQHDEPAVGTAWTPAAWRPGRWTPDPRSFRIPPGTPPGRYRLELGAYLVGGRPLEFETSAGRALRLPLGDVTVVRGAKLADPPVDLPIGRELAPGLWLVGVEFAQFEAREGDTLRPTLVWRATSTAPSGSIALRLVLPDGTVAAATVGEPVGGRYPLAEWQAGELVRDPRELTIAAGTAGIGRLEVSAGRGWIPVAEVRVEARQRRYDLPALGRPLGARLGEVAELASAAIADGRPAQVTLVWRAIRGAETSYTVFVQALDEAGRVVAQRDAPPRDGAALTSSWLPGEVVVDEVVLVPRPEVAAGTYRLIVGMYDQRTGVRLRQPNGEDYVELGVVRFD